VGELVENSVDGMLKHMGDIKTPFKLLEFPLDRNNFNLDI
jgi:hypothetical protein